LVPCWGQDWIADGVKQVPEKPGLDIIIAQKGGRRPRDEVWLKELEVLPAEQDEILVRHVVAACRLPQGIVCGNLRLSPCCSGEPEW